MWTLRRALSSPRYSTLEALWEALSQVTLASHWSTLLILASHWSGLISDSTGRPASTCSVMLITAVPCMFLYQVILASHWSILLILASHWLLFLYQWLEGRGCKITPDHGAPVHNICFTLSILVTLVTGILVNGPYALITTAVSAELGKIARKIVSIAGIVGLSLKMLLSSLGQ